MLNFFTQQSSKKFGHRVQEFGAIYKKLTPEVEFNLKKYIIRKLVQAERPNKLSLHEFYVRHWPYLNDIFLLLSMFKIKQKYFNLFQLCIFLI